MNASLVKPKILITGGTGYIGSVLSYDLLNQGYEVVSINSKSRRYFRSDIELKKLFGIRYRHYDVSITEGIEDVFTREKKIEAVVHLAGKVSVDESMREPYDYFYNNAVVTEILLRSMDKYRITKLVFGSTSAVYGELDGVVDESDRTVPQNPYGESKLIAEKMIQWYGKTRGLHYMILRYFNVSGAADDGKFGDTRQPSLALIQNAVRAALADKPFYFTADSRSVSRRGTVRDYVHVLDVCGATESSIWHLVQEGKSDILNIGTGKGYSIEAILEEVEDAIQKKIQIQDGVPRQGEIATLSASISKARKVLGWKPKKSLHECIKSLELWYRHNPTL